MKKIPLPAVLLAIACLAAAVPLHAADATEGGHYRTVPGAETPAATAAKDHPVPEFFVPPPPFSDGIFPCSDCHEDQEVNYERREMEDFHEEIRIINHNEEERWCLDCHNPEDRDVLRLASGRLVSFEESYYLCGQCHGTIFRDWKAGVHGRRTGEWNGRKTYRLCVHCHNPHQPRFKPVAPKPPPIKPKDIK
ncbi:MAG: hypothetical protein JSV26_11645 [bacterium]|nr:MAG: hypothetical protein JSV26_11645 [bacterium]